MNKDELFLSSTLDRPIAFQRIFVSVTGSVNAALFLSQCLYWSKRTTAEGGWFYKSREEWTEETGLTRWEQESVRKVLVGMNILMEKKEGTPCRLFYRVQLSELKQAIELCLSPNELSETDNPVGGKLTNLLEGSQPASHARLRIGTENTTESTIVSKPPAKKPEVFILPQILDTPEFATAWGEWLAYRRERKLAKYAPRTFDSMMKKFAAVGVDYSIKTIEYCIRMAYQGCDPDWVKDKIGVNSSTPFKWKLEQDKKELQAKLSRIGGNVTGMAAEEVNAQKERERTAIKQQIADIDAQLPTAK